MSKVNARVGDQLFQKMEKINGELFTLTYGAMVAQMIQLRQNF